MTTGVYDTYIDDEFSVIAVELDLCDAVPIDSHEHCMIYGLSVPGECDKTEAVKLLDDFQWALIDAVVEQTNAKYVGRIRREVDRDLVFYFSTAGIDGISDVDSPSLNQDSFTAVQVTLEHLPDSDWQVYQDLLLPSEGDKVDVCVAKE